MRRSVGACAMRIESEKWTETQGKRETREGERNGGRGGEEERVMNVMCVDMIGGGKREKEKEN